MLENVLTVLSVYDPKVGYVQGMNFIAGLFCYHAEEYIAFWLMAMVIEIFEMRDIYKSSSSSSSSSSFYILTNIFIYFNFLTC